ncbi:MAG: ribonuclease III [Symbiobacteriaceae bacterium]|nr:ribonuclease III [Symbiobacteriaceae bacterium]
MKSSIETLLAEMGVASLPEDLLRQAFTHLSLVHEKGLSSTDSNERLEFLGDAVVELAITEELFLRSPDLSEGKLTALRAQIVCGDSLAAKARSLNLGSFLLMGSGESKSGGAHKPALLADALEALFGVVFLTYGYETTANLVVSLLLPPGDPASFELPRDHQWKTRLQEMVQQDGAHDIFYDTTKSGADHEPLFQAVLLVDGLQRGQGQGRSKQEAQQAAARDAVQKMSLLGRDMFVS